MPESIRFWKKRIEETDADAEQFQFPAIFARLIAHSANTITLARRELERQAADDATDREKEHLAKRQAMAAITLYRMGDYESVWPLLRSSPDPRVRSYIVHWLGPLGGDPRAILARVDSESDVTIQQAFLFILGESSDTPLSIAQRQPLVEKLLHMYENEPDAGLHAAAEWLLRKWEPGERLNVLIEKLKADEHALQARRHHDKRQWYVNSQGQTFVIVEPGEFQMGSPIGEPGHVANEIRRRRRITRRFAIAATEVTRKAASRGPSLVSPQSNFVKTEDSPETGFDWYGAAQYCNWLSEQEGIPPDQWCYEPNEEGKYAPGMKAKSDFLDLHGYRLPVEVEWEYACRAGTVTSRYFGESESLLPEYAWYLANAENRTWPVGSLKPNGWGLFNMLGNAAEWCHDQYFGLPPTMDPSEAVIGKPDTAARVLRGGAFDLASVSIRSATRLFYQPGNRHVTNGFRPAKTCP